MYHPKISSCLHLLQAAKDDDCIIFTSWNKESTSRKCWRMSLSCQNWLSLPFVTLIREARIYDRPLPPIRRCYLPQLPSRSEEWVLTGVTHSPIHICYLLRLWCKSPRQQIGKDKAVARTCALLLKSAQASVHRAWSTCTHSPQKYSCRLLQ